MPQEPLFNFIVRYPWVFFAVIAWSVVWKGIALWKAARRGETIWFIAILVLNTLGILEIVYIFYVIRKKTADAKMRNNSNSRNFDIRI